MKFVAAYLLASMGGNPSPTKDDVHGILDSVGAEVEEDKLELLFKKVEGKDVAEHLAAGREKFVFAPCGGGAAAVDAAAPVVAASFGAGVGAAAAEEKAREKMEEEDDDNIFGLFDD